LGIIRENRSIKPPRMGARRLSVGFTLIELLITMLIVALMLSVATPRFAAMLPGAKLRHTTLVLAADLRSARSDAISGGRVLAVQFDVADRHYGVDIEKSVTDWPEKIQLEVVVPESMLNDQQQPEIWFYPDGSSSGGEIHCSSGGRSFVVSVNWLAGWVAVQG
jgi:general secretion pathway protein H